MPNASPVLIAPHSDAALCGTVGKSTSDSVSRAVPCLSTGAEAQLATPDHDKSVKSPRRVGDLEAAQYSEGKIEGREGLDENSNIRFEDKYSILPPDELDDVKRELLAEVEGAVPAFTKADSLHTFQDVWVRALQPLHLGECASPSL